MRSEVGKSGIISCVDNCEHVNILYWQNAKRNRTVLLFNSFPQADELWIWSEELVLETNVISQGRKRKNSDL